MNHTNENKFMDPHANRSDCFSSVSKNKMNKITGHVKANKSDCFSSASKAPYRVVESRLVKNS